MAKKKSTGKKNTVAATNRGVRRFERVEGASSKFWEVSQTGSNFTVRFGRIGTEGQSAKTKDAGSAENATAVVKKLIREKTRKGYAEVTSAATKIKKTIVGMNSPSPIEEIPANARKPLTKQYLQSIAATLRSDKTTRDSANFSRYDAITVEAAEELAPYYFDLDLSGLKDISVLAIHAFNKFAIEGNESRWHTCDLDLSGLQTISSDLAAAFVERFQHLPSYAAPGNIVFGVTALEQMSPLGSRLLAKCKAHIIVASDNSSSCLSTSVAEILCKNNRGEMLEMCWVRKASDDALAVLSKHCGGQLSLDGLPSVSDAAAESLSKHKGGLSLSGVTSLSDAAAESLSKCRGDLILDGLTSLSDAAAESLSKHKGRLSLDGVKSLSLAAAENLRNHNGGISLCTLAEHAKSLSDAVADIISASYDWSLSLDSLQNLSDNAAESLSKFQGWHLTLGDKLKYVTDSAAESLLRFLRTAGNELHCSDQVEELIKAARKRIATAGKEPLWASLAEARKAGAALLRTVWHGHGDDGYFEHELFKNGQRIDFEGDVEADVATILQENGFIVEGEMNGSVGILEINLQSGQAAFWDASQAAETERFAEFLMRCEWAQAESLTASISLLGDGDERLEQEATKVTTDPASAKKLLQPELEILLDTIDHLEGGEELTKKIRRLCGTSVSLTVNVAARTFVFSGKGKKVSVKVPKDELAVTRFKVDLGSSTDTNLKTAKKGKK